MTVPVLAVSFKPGEWEADYQGDYSVTDTYQVGHIVRYEAAYYRCIVKTTGDLPTASDFYWLFLGAELGEGGGGGGGGIEKQESYHSAEQTELGEGEVPVSAAEPDKIELTLPETSLVAVYLSVQTKSPSKQTAVSLCLDGAPALDEAENAIKGSRSANGYGQSNISYVAGFPTIEAGSAGPGKTSGIGAPFTVVLAAGAHSFEIKYRLEGTPQNKNGIKERRLVTLVL